MSEDNFTPNWRLDDGHEETVSEYYHYIEGGTSCRPDGFMVAGFLPLKDARLMSEALNLFEALDELQRSVAMTLIKHDLNVDKLAAFLADRPDIEVKISRAQKALAKARGE